MLAYAVAVAPARARPLPDGAAGRLVRDRAGRRSCSPSPAASLTGRSAGSGSSRRTRTRGAAGSRRASRSTSSSGRSRSGLRDGRARRVETSGARSTSGSGSSAIGATAELCARPVLRAPRGERPRSGSTGGPRGDPRVRSARLRRRPARRCCASSRDGTRAMLARARATRTARSTATCSQRERLIGPGRAPSIDARGPPARARGARRRPSSAVLVPDESALPRRRCAALGFVEQRRLAHMRLGELELPGERRPADRAAQLRDGLSRAGASDGAARARPGAAASAHGAASASAQVGPCVLDHDAADRRPERHARHDRRAQPGEGLGASCRAPRAGRRARRTTRTPGAIGMPATTMSTHITGSDGANSGGHQPDAERARASARSAARAAAGPGASRPDAADQRAGREAREREPALRRASRAPRRTPACVTSTTPNAQPSAMQARITVRTPGEPSAPRRERVPACRWPLRGLHGRRQREPERADEAERARHEHRRPTATSAAAMPPTSTGPSTNASSCSQASSAYAVSRSPAAGSMLGQSVRMHAPIGGSVAPGRRPRARRARSGDACAVREQRRAAPSESGNSKASGSSTRVWPTRSIRRPTNGAAAAARDRERRDDDADDRVRVAGAADQQHGADRHHAERQAAEQAGDHDLGDARGPEQRCIAPEAARLREARHAAMLRIA